MRDRFEELMADPCCASCDCDSLSSEVAVYLDRKSCDSERCRAREDCAGAPAHPARRASVRALNEG